MVATDAKTRYPYVSSSGRTITRRYFTVSNMEFREFWTPPTVPLNCSSTPSCGCHIIYHKNVIYQMRCLLCLPAIFVWHWGRKSRLQSGLLLWQRGTSKWKWYLRRSTHLLAGLKAGCVSRCALKMVKLILPLRNVYNRFQFIVSLVLNFFSFSALVR